MFDKGRRCIAGRDEPQGISIPTEDVAEVGVTDAGGILQHGREHGLKIAGGAADNLKNLRRCRLLLKRFGEVGCAFGEVTGALA